MSDSAATTFASPREVVEQYNYEMWNEQKFDIGTDIIGAALVRNTPGACVTLTQAQAIQRVRDHCAAIEFAHFTLLRIVADDELCTIVYQAEMRRHDGTTDTIGSIEMYRVVEGRIVEVWNNTIYEHQRWPEFTAQGHS